MVKQEKIKKFRLWNGRGVDGKGLTFFSRLIVLLSLLSFCLLVLSFVYVFKPFNWFNEGNLHGSAPEYSESFFDDVEKGSSAANAVMYFKVNVCSAMEKGWLSQRANFNPDDTISLAEAIKIISKAGNVQVDDVLEGDWFSPYMLLAAKKGWLDDLNVTDANSKLSRIDAVKLLYKCTKEAFLF